MTNYEKYKDWFNEHELDFKYGSVELAVMEKDNTPAICGKMNSCGDCKLRLYNTDCEDARVKWLKEEYEDPNVDWSKVKVDTKIQVRQNTDQHWINAYFKSYENGKVRTWPGCGNSWLNIDCTAYSEWNYARIYKEE